jgi:hypothetical protein
MQKHETDTSTIPTKGKKERECTNRTDDIRLSYRYCRHDDFWSDNFCPLFLISKVYGRFNLW